MGIIPGQRVHHSEDPVTIGTVLEVGPFRAIVAWDGGGHAKHWIDDLVPAHGRRLPNPPSIAPTIEDLEFQTRFDPITGSLYIVRDGSYRGDDGDFPEIRISGDAFDMLRGMSLLPAENIAVLLLTSSDNVFAMHRTHQGHLDSVEASLRQILTPALLSGRARGIIFAHNHPSGDPGHSPDDERLTHAVENAAARLGIRLVDHLVIGRPGAGRDEYFSFRDAGKMNDPELAPELPDPPPPPPIMTDGISDMEFVVERDEESGSIRPVRDGDYRGDAGEKPVIDGLPDLKRLFPEIGDDGTVVALFDTRQALVGWTAWGDARGETPDRLALRAVTPPLIMNARSVAILRATGQARPTRNDDALTTEVLSLYGDLDIELFDHVLLGDDGSAYSYCDAGRIPDRDDT